MNRRETLLALAALGAPPLIAHAQPAASLTVIGLLDGGERREWWDAFRDQLRELGYVEGRNIRFEQRFAKGKLDGLPALATELVQMKVAVIVTSSSAAAIAAERATRSIPIVTASGGDHVGRGLATSLGKPGGNVTGVASLSSDLMAKRLELLREVAPKLSRVAALWQSDNPSSTTVKQLETAAAAARIAFQSVRFRDEADLTGAFAAMARERIEGIVVIHGPLVYLERKRIAELALSSKLPAVYGSAEYADAGGLLTYGPSYPDLSRRAAIYVDKILKGANPATLPIEQPTRFELVVNISAARALGVTIPPSVLARANRVVQ